MLMMCTRLLSFFFRYTRIGSLLILFLLSCLGVKAQNATRHYIPPVSWQYWSDANELVISTINKDPVEVSIRKSDNTLLSKVTVSFNKPIAYRFAGDPRFIDAHPYRTVLKGAGLIVESNSGEIFVNVRNVTSDYFKDSTERRVKGNSSMVSFGDQGVGINFRLGYYRYDYRLVGWIPPFGPVYSILAINNNTDIKINGTYVTTLMAGEAYLFQDGMTPSPLRFNPFFLGTEATQGSQLQASAPVVVAVSTLHDSPGGSADGVMDQIAPNTVLGTDYLIVRGEGRAANPTSTRLTNHSNFPEQTSIIATEDNTEIKLQHFDPTGNEITSPTQPLITLNKGQSHTFHHGDSLNPYSTSFIKATKKILVLYGTGVGGEVDISTVPPLNACAGSDTLETIQFTNYWNEPLKYFGFIISDSPTDPVTINGMNVESISGARTPIGNTGFYLMKFDHQQIGNPNIITVRSKKTVAVSFTQRRNAVSASRPAVTSMSSYFSLFNKIPKIAQVRDSACNRKVLIGEPGLAPYQWYKDDEPIPGATDERFIATENGNYSYTGSRECGVTAPSAPIYVEAGPIEQIRTSVNIAICNGATYNGHDKSGLYIDTLKSLIGCDSIVTVDLIVNEPTNTIIDTAICEGDAFKGYTKTGTYTEAFVTKNNCDSIVTIILTILPKQFVTIDTSLCEGTVLTTPKTTYNKAGTYTEVYQTNRGCDSTVTINLSYRAAIRVAIDTSICFGTTYISPKGTYSKADTYTEIYTAANKCDSIVTIRLKVDPKITTAYTKKICQGNTYSTPKQNYTASGTFTEIYKTPKGCDSTVTFQLIVNPLKFTTVDTSICEGEKLTTPKTSYNKTGTYKEVYQSFDGCDSTVTINLAIISKGNNLEYITICEGEAYRGYTSSGTYNETRTSASGCAANFTVFLTVLPKARKTIDTSICFGTSYKSSKGTYTAAGTYTEIYTAFNKCDSVVTINLKIDPKITSGYTKEICQGESYTTLQKTYTTAGTFTEIYTSAKGCDSTVTFQLIVNPLKYTTIDTSLCEGQLLTTPKTTYNKAGTYKEVYQSSKGCDSTMTINLSYRIIPRVIIHTSICFGTAYTSPKGTYSAAGTYTEIFTAANKCDSIVTINLKIDPKVTFNYSKEICLGDTYTTPQKNYTTAGTFTEIYKTSKGCDSTITFQLIVNPLKFTTVDTSLCEGQLLTTPKTTYTKAGTYTEFYKSSKGCDSTVTIYLSYRNVILVTIDTSLCFGTTYTSPEGTYSAAGTYTEIYTAANKCDSIVTIRLNVDPKITSTYSKEICRGTTFSTPLKNYTTAGTFTEIYKTSKGCDSTVTINLIVKPTFETNLNKTICEGDNFKGYTTSGSYKESYTAINGCDSTVNIYLTVLKKSYVTFNRSVCQGDNFRGFTTTGTFVETFTAANGCDSIITTRLTVLSRDTVYESKTICEGESYRGFTQSGNYTVPFFNQNNCESIIYVNLNVLKKSYLKITQSICEGESFRGYTISGIYTEKYLAANGCDSIVTIDLRVIRKQNRTIRVDICEGSSHRGYTKTGIYTEIFTAVTGCDSIVTTILTVRPHTRSEIYQTICEGQQLDGYNETGTYTDTLINRWGCDSIRVLHLTVEKKAFQFFEGIICQGEQYVLPNGKRVSNAGIYVDTVRTRFGCDSLIRTTTLTLKPGPVFTVSKSNDINCVISQAQLTVTGGARYLWSPSSTLDSVNSATPIASPKETTTYNVRVWGRNGCSFTKDITVYADFNGDGPRYPIPSAFTPNKDGLNDCFNVRHWGPVQNFKMDIFNRWGEKVFSTTNIQSCWDGTINKIPLPSGIFIYKISANGPCGNMFRTGQITLIR